MSTLAHEIGHVLFGSDHPDNSVAPGPASLPGTDWKARLMHSGFGHPNPKVRCLLVKGEWDEAETWLIDNIDGNE